MRALRKNSFAWIIGMLLIGTLLTGCTSTPLAARWDTGSLSEDEVTRFTEEFRSAHFYDADETWAQYLYDQGLTTETWRLRAITNLVEERLLLERAKELGIEADAEEIAEEIRIEKIAAGIEEGDEEAWDRYLSARGLTMQTYQEALETANVETQLLESDIEAQAEITDSQLSEFIRENLASRVVRRYSVLGFDTLEQAQSAREDLMSLKGEARRGAFANWTQRDDLEQTTLDNGGDIGWDISQDIPAQNELNDEMLDIDAISAVHEVNGRYLIFLCTNRHGLLGPHYYDDLPDEDLKSFVRDSALYAGRKALFAEYIGRLRDEAHVQVQGMPAKVPYDVDNLVEALAQSESIPSESFTKGGNS